MSPVAERLLALALSILFMVILHRAITWTVHDVATESVIDFGFFYVLPVVFAAGIWVLVDHNILKPRRDIGKLPLYLEVLRVVMAIGGLLLAYVLGLGLFYLLCWPIVKLAMSFDNQTASTVLLCVFMVPLFWGPGLFWLHFSNTRAGPWFERKRRHQRLEN